MAFTDQEMLVLSQLVYKNHEFKDYGQQDLYYILSKNKKYLNKNLGSQFDEILDNLMEKVKGKNYEMVKNTTDSRTGFAAMAIKDPNNEVTVVARGTDGFDPKSAESRKDVIYGDAGLIMGTGETPQHKCMEKFMDELEADNNGKGYSGYSFTGHSLGGNLALYAAIYLSEKKKGKVRKVTTFNAPQFNDWFCYKHKKGIKAINDITTQYENEYDIVSSVNDNNTIGKVIICESADRDGYQLDFDDHSLGCFFMDGTDFVETNRKKPTSSAVSRLTKSLNFPISIRGFTSVLKKAALVVLFEFLGNLISDAFKKISASSRLAKKNPHIEIDTTKMKGYATRLSKLSRKAKQLDKNMNSLYSSCLSLNIFKAASDTAVLLKCEDISDLAYSHLDRAVNYLNETAKDFEKAENRVTNMTR